MLVAVAVAPKMDLQIMFIPDLEDLLMLHGVVALL
jgi:hypothetical protein